MKGIFLCNAGGRDLSSGRHSTEGRWDYPRSPVISASAASGIINGLGAGAGGTLAGFLVGLLYKSTRSYMSGFFVLGVLVMLGGAALLAYGHIKQVRPIMVHIPAPDLQRS